MLSETYRWTGDVKLLEQYRQVAAGFKRYGLVEEATKVIRAIFDAARRFEAYQLPEILAGLSRKDVEDFPALYPPGANIPQEQQQHGHVQGKVVLRVA